MQGHHHWRLGGRRAGGDFCRSLALNLRPRRRLQFRVIIIISRPPAIQPASQHGLITMMLPLVHRRRAASTAPRTGGRGATWRAINLASAGARNSSRLTWVNFSHSFLRASGRAPVGASERLMAYQTNPFQVRQPASQPARLRQDTFSQTIISLLEPRGRVRAWRRISRYAHGAARPGRPIGPVWFT